MSKVQKRLTPNSKKPTSNLSLFILGYLIFVLPSAAGKSISSNKLIILLGAYSLLGVILKLIAIGTAIARKFNKK